MKSATKRRGRRFGSMNKGSDDYDFGPKKTLSARRASKLMWSPPHDSQQPKSERSSSAEPHISRLRDRSQKTDTSRATDLLADPVTNSTSTRTPSDLAGREHIGLRSCVDQMIEDTYTIRPAPESTKRKRGRPRKVAKRKSPSYEPPPIDRSPTPPGGRPLFADEIDIKDVQLIEDSDRDVQAPKLTPEMQEDSDVGSDLPATYEDFLSPAFSSSCGCCHRPMKETTPPLNNDSYRIVLRNYEATKCNTATANVNPSSTCNVPADPKNKLQPENSRWYRSVPDSEFCSNEEERAWLGEDDSEAAERTFVQNERTHYRQPSTDTVPAGFLGGNRRSLTSSRQTTPNEPQSAPATTMVDETTKQRESEHVFAARERRREEFVVQRKPIDVGTGPGRRTFIRPHSLPAATATSRYDRFASILRRRWQMAGQDVNNVEFNLHAIKTWNRMTKAEQMKYDNDDSSAPRAAHTVKSAPAPQKEEWRQRPAVRDRGKPIVVLRSELAYDERGTHEEVSSSKRPIEERIKIGSNSVLVNFQRQAGSDIRPDVQRSDPMGAVNLVTMTYGGVEEVVADESWRSPPKKIQK